MEPVEAERILSRMILIINKSPIKRALKREYKKISRRFILKKAKKLLKRGFISKLIFSRYNLIYLFSQFKRIHYHNRFKKYKKNKALVVSNQIFNTRLANTANILITQYMYNKIQRHKLKVIKYLRRVKRTYRKRKGSFHRIKFHKTYIKNIALNLNFFRYYFGPKRIPSILYRNKYKQLFRKKIKK